MVRPGRLTRPASWWAAGLARLVELVWAGGVALRSPRLLAVAARGLRRLLRQGPAQPAVHNRLGCYYWAIRREWDRALCHALMALHLNPASVDGRASVAVALTAMGRPDAALPYLNAVIAECPDRPALVWERADVLLKLGDLAAGFRDWEARWQTPDYALSSDLDHLAGLPRWTGEALGGRWVLLWEYRWNRYTDSGYGDAIQMARYVGLVADRGGRVVLACEPAVARLLRTARGVERIIGPIRGRPDGVDCHAPLGSLPGLFRTTLATIPATVPYLTPPADARLQVPAPGPAVLVGIVWAGDSRHSNDAQRSLPAEALYPLVGLSGVAWYSLQVGPRARDLKRLGLADLVHDLSPQLTDFAETAAAVQQLDVVVTVDTAVAHLAGALGKPVWVLLPAWATDWRWMVGRPDSPWYPTMTLIRQTWRGCGWTCWTGWRAA